MFKKVSGSFSYDKDKNTFILLKLLKKNQRIELRESDQNINWRAVRPNVEGWATFDLSDKNIPIEKIILREDIRN